MIASLIVGCCLAPAAAVPQSQPEKLIEEGHWKRARAIVEPWIRAKPGDALANFLLSQIRNAFHDRQSPLPLAEKAVQLDGRTAKYHRQLAEVLGVTAQYSGMLRQLILARRFRKEIGIALDEDPRDLQALRDLMEFYLLAPGIVGGDKDQARAVASRIEGLDVAAGLMARARLADFYKEPGNAQAFLRKAVARQPQNYRARIALAAEYLASDRRHDDLAEQQAREALAIDCSRVDAYSVLAAVIAARGNWAELDRLLATAEQEVPDDLTPFYRAAETMLAWHREWPRAARLLRRYLAAEPEGNAPTVEDARKLVALTAASGGTLGFRGTAGDILPR